MSAMDLWNSTFGLMFRRPPRRQVAALCWREGPQGPEILMITSRETKRWVLPKGSLKRGRTAEEMAAEEAWEEAGLRVDPALAVPVGSFRYRKVLSGGAPAPTEVEVFALPAGALDDEFPEAAERRREWMRPEAAAAAVREPDLAELLRRFGTTPRGPAPGT